MSTEQSSSPMAVPMIVDGQWNPRLRAAMTGDFFEVAQGRTLWSKDEAPDGRGGWEPIGKTQVGRKHDGSMPVRRRFGPLTRRQEDAAAEFILNGLEHQTSPGEAAAELDRCLAETGPAQPGMAARILAMYDRRSQGESAFLKRIFGPDPGDRTLRGMITEAAAGGPISHSQ